ncbi:MAG: Ig-like domain-containing protein [Anaerolineae bacterium]|nr:Ig-like domain-containing protein [Anaerolineae bacterium]
MAKKTQRAILTILHSILLLGMLTAPVARADTPAPGADAPLEFPAMRRQADIPPTQVRTDEDGYTLWTVDWGTQAWCVPVSTLRYPFDLGTQDPTQLADTSLILEFSEGLYHHDVVDPSWTVALNGSPPEDWQSVGAISGPVGDEEPIWNTEVITFDALRLLDGENNIWLQQHDLCPQEPGCTTCACTCINLKRYTLRAAVKMQVKRVSPAPDAVNVLTGQQPRSDIRVTFTTPADPETVNNETFQVYYHDPDLDPVYVAGEVTAMSSTEFAFVPAQPLRDGIRYEVRVWGRAEALDEDRDGWVAGQNGTALEVGRIWSFWTMPDIEVSLQPVQVVTGVPLIVNKPTVIRVFLRWEAKDDVFELDQVGEVTVNDIVVSWDSAGGHQGSAHWNGNDYGWRPARNAQTAVRKREYLEFTSYRDSYDKAAKVAGRDSVNYFGFVPLQSGGYDLTAEVKIMDNRGKAQSFKAESLTEAVAVRRFGLYAKAVAVGPDYGKTGTVDLSASIQESFDAFKAIYPVATVTRPATPAAMPYYTPTTSLWLFDWRTSPAWGFPKKYLLQEMSLLCARTNGCDAMVGFVNQGWLTDVGLSLPESAPKGTLAQTNTTGPYCYVPAHEVGHLLGFEHDTLHGSEGYAVSARRDMRYSVTQWFPQTQKTFNNINNFMNIDPVESPPVERLWIHFTAYNTILNRLMGSTARAAAQTTSADGLLLVSGGIVEATSETQLLPWYQLEPGTWSAPEPGPYTLRFLDGGGQEIAGYSQPFTVSASTFVTEPALFAFKVPFPATMAQAQIRRTGDNALLAQIAPGAAAPGVSLDPAPAVWSGAQALTWQTTSPITLHYALDVSLDGGATWEAQAVNLTEQGYTVTTAALPDTDQAWIRLAASDGLRTATVVSGPYTLDNPPLVAAVTPLPEATVNVDQLLTVGFRDAMDPGSVNSATITLSGGPAGVAPIAVPGVISYSVANREATFTTKAPLAYAARYTATVTTGAHDVAGEPLPAAYSWSFDTEADGQPPQPLLFSPARGARGVATDAQVLVLWDKPLEAGTINTATFTIQVAASGAAVGGSVSYDPATRAARFTPAGGLISRTTYIVALHPGIQAAAGVSTTGGLSWTLSTGDRAGSGPAFTGAYSEEGVDGDGDGLFEQLVIRAGVQVSSTAVYRLRGSLTDAAGAEIAWTSVTATLQPGANVMPLAFGGAAIGGAAIGRSADGPYTLTGLTLARSGMGSVTAPLAQAVNVYRTFAYSAAQFPAPLRFGGLPDVRLRPEETLLNPAFNVRSYAHHALLDSAQLTYTLLSNDDLRAGVTLDGNGNVWVKPAAGWAGSAGVTIQAGDGVLGVRDTFRVTVGWAHNIHLPVVLRHFDARPVARSNWVVALSDDFEADGPWTYRSSISIPPGGWYYWGRRDCKAYSGQYSMWPFGDGDDGALLPCDAAYPDTLESNMVSGISFNLTHVSQAELRMKVWTDLAPGDEICAMAALDAPVPDNDPRWLDYYGVCRSGTSNGWEDLALDLSAVPTLGNLIGEEKIWIAVRFRANESESRPGGVYVDDVLLRLCPEGLTCDPDLGYTITLPPPPTGNFVGDYRESVNEAALAVEDNGRIHAAWTGVLNPHFDTFAFYATSADGVNWTRYDTLNRWQTYDPQLAVDSARQRAHLVYRSNYDGILHHVIENGEIVPVPSVLDKDAVTLPKLAVNPANGRLHAVWHEGYYYPIGNDMLSWRRRLWYAAWDGTGWSAPQKPVNDNDTGYGAIAAAPDGGVMLAWFQQWAQSAGGATDPGDPIVPRTAYGTQPGDFPLRQAVSAPYAIPEKDNSILLAYSPGDGKYYLAATHLMWPGHSRVYRYVWENGAWAGPLDVAENTAGWATAWYVGAASDQPLVTYVYRNGDALYARTESNGVLGAAYNLNNALAARGYTGTPVAFFVDRAGGLHMLVAGAKDGVEGFYYVHP